MITITSALARKLISQQFPEYAHLRVSEVEKQGHDNRTYRLGDHMLIRMPTAENYALKVPKEQELLPKLARHLSISIPAPIKMGKPSEDYPYPFSIYKWLAGRSINLMTLNEEEMKKLAFDLAKFLKELQNIKDVDGPSPGQHNWWRGDHISIYDKGAREQIANLSHIIDGNKVLDLWERACDTWWREPPVWIHGDFAIGNILVSNRHCEPQSGEAIQENSGSPRFARDDDSKAYKLSAVIDFGGAAIGDPACDLVIAWTYFSGKSREIFIQEIDLDEETWLRARAWALWKATFELCNIVDKTSPEARLQKRIIDEVING